MVQVLDPEQGKDQRGRENEDQQAVDQGRNPNPGGFFGGGQRNLP
jgi:hypothetical protein